ncbi:hypothetical protein C8R47DRAFT_1195124 [Mycena vitilis]|nr:hypothetical protein C8R47DRAFT_1195124 [Mycena vitilis]
MSLSIHHFTSVDACNIDVRMRTPKSYINIRVGAEPAPPLHVPRLLDAAGSIDPGEFWIPHYTALRTGRLPGGYTLAGPTLQVPLTPELSARLSLPAACTDSPPPPRTAVLATFRRPSHSGSKLHLLDLETEFSFVSRAGADCVNLRPFELAGRVPHAAHAALGGKRSKSQPAPTRARGRLSARFRSLPSSAAAAATTRCRASHVVGSRSARSTGASLVLLSLASPPTLHEMSVVHARSAVLSFVSVSVLIPYNATNKLYNKTRTLLMQSRPLSLLLRFLVLANFVSGLAINTGQIYRPVQESIPTLNIVGRSSNRIRRTTPAQRSRICLRYAPRALWMVVYGTRERAHPASP